MEEMSAPVLCDGSLENHYKAKEALKARGKHSAFIILFYMYSYLTLH